MTHIVSRVDDSMTAGVSTRGREVSHTEAGSRRPHSPESEISTAIELETAAADTLPEGTGSQGV
jgi:hypothetical protein